ncbi:hypothetical protein GJB62_22575 [Nostoc sp. ATCC 53789]|nr:hypothetical protein GJB62_22575 [Nostoc sp. ATCC 53789]
MKQPCPWKGGKQENLVPSPFQGYGVHTSPSKVIREGVVGSKRRWKIQSEYTRKQ